MNRLFSATIFAASYAFSHIAVAACGQGGETVFSCRTSTGKIIQVCDFGKTIGYSFGKPTVPEIVVRAPRNAASTYQWQGLGRSTHYSVQIPNGETVYVVYWSLDRSSPERDIDAGVQVEVNKATVARVKCLKSEDIVQNIEGIDLKPSE